MNDLEVARDLRATASYLRTHGWLRGNVGHDGESRCLGGALYSTIGVDWWTESADEASIAPHLLALGFSPAADFSGEGFQYVSYWNDHQPALELVLDRLESTALGLEIRALKDTTEALAAERLEMLA